MKVLFTGRLRGGTPSLDLIKMVHYNHPEVEFIPYGPKEKGFVILGINRTMEEDKREIRKVMYLGSIPSFLKSNNREKIKSLDHIFFISDYCKNIFLSKFDFENYSTFLPFGPLPADFDMTLIDCHRSINGPIQFVAVAKWYKRPYKRLDQILKLYHNFLRKEYPDSILNIIGTLKSEVKDGVHYYRKGFGDINIIDIFKNSHIHLIPTAFDTGPKTIPESMHYRVPFVCSNNCSGIEYISKVGNCGIEVETDYMIDSWGKYKSADPLNAKSKFVRNRIPYEEYFKAVKEIVNKFEEYTSWKWNEKLNYKDQSDMLYNILRGT